MMMTKSKWRQLASFLLLTTVFALPATAANLTSFTADYIVYRAGDKHGEAQRYLKQNGTEYEFGYSSDISWLVFSDKRSETSHFTIENNQIKPSLYTMKRSGTGPNRHYELHIDQANKQLRVGKKRQLKPLVWQDDILDLISYQLQLSLDLQAGKTEFSYTVLNKNGNPKVYHYKVIAEELLPLPYGNIRTLRIARVEDDADSDKQIYAWVAPDLNYMLVRLWRGEDNVEQFDVQLHKLTLDETH
ncbi:DUF3108 domain-containing protein [Rheinheimera sp. WS51]|uniref:DUF3108 domain-containing protein n=1 Tax=Rheinheimera sp. WS51 TaxID=3425886 RepID=UPI003D92A7EE